MVTRLPELTRALEAEDPAKLIAEIARLRRENDRLTDLTALYRDVPVSVAIAYSRKANGLPDPAPAAYAAAGVAA